MSASPAHALAGTAFSIAAVVASAGVMLSVGSRSDDPHEAAGVFPPWWDRSAVVAAAGQAGAIRDLGAVPFIVVVRTPAADADRRLREAGALFTVAPSGVGFCL